MVYACLLVAGVRAYYVLTTSLLVAIIIIIIVHYYYGQTEHYTCMHA
jgi:hypothetical protein